MPPKPTQSKPTTPKSTTPKPTTSKHTKSKHTESKTTKSKPTTSEPEPPIPPNPKETSNPHSRALLKSYRPVRLFLKAIGQLPFQIRKRADGVFAYKFEKKSLHTIIFAFTTVIFSIIYVLITIGLLDIALGRVLGIEAFEIEAETVLRGTTNVTWVNAMVCNHLSAVVVTHCFLSVTFIGSMYILTRGSRYIHYCNHWFRVVQVLDMNPTEGVRQYLVREIIVFGIVAVAEIISFELVVGIKAVSGIYALLVFQFIDPYLPIRSFFCAAQVFGFVVIVYGHFGARAIILQFVYFAYLLKNASKIWNERLMTALEVYLTESAEEAKQKRHEFRALLKDHFIISQLFKMTEVVFGLILRVFFFGQFLSLLFEVFYLWKILGPPSITVDIFNASDINGTIVTFRPKDPPPAPDVSEVQSFAEEQIVSESVVTIILTLQTLATSYMTAAIGHAAFKEAMKGLGIVRRRGLLLCQTKTERNFIHTLIISFGRVIPIDITANAYFIVNKPFVVGMIAAVAAYFVIAIQLDVPRYLVKEQDYRLNWGAYIKSNR